MASPDRLNVWLEAFDQPVGRLMRQDGGAVAFAYTPDHLNGPAALPISLSMPLTDRLYGDVAARAFFDNLLQENDSLRVVMARESIARDDLIGLLAILGADCPGAISCLREDAPPVKRPGDLALDYDGLNDQDLERILKSLAETGALPAGNKDPSPLAGVQPKIAVTRLPTGNFALPKPHAHVPTTHIIKVPRRRDASDAKLEQFCTSLARLAGLATATISDFDKFGTQGLLIERFDRVVDGNGVYRVHQEDFAQALGLPAEMKYERRGRAAKRFDAASIASVLDQCSRPAQARETFIDLTLFNLLIGNVDNHAKNHALLFPKPGAPVLAPAYDLLATRLNSEFTDEFAFRIGAARKLDELTKADLEEFIGFFGLKGRGARRFLDAHARALIQTLASEAILNDLTRNRQKRLADYIAHAARHLASALNLPSGEIASRDAYIERGGGWLTS